MTRVFIIGGPGSGKTTLGRRLARLLDIPLVELDAIGYEDGAGPARSSAAREADVKVIARQDVWVAEGAFIGWTEPLAMAADHVIWLDVPWRIARSRIVSRHVRASLGGNNRHKGLLKLWRFLQFANTYYTSDEGPENRAQTAIWLAQFGVKVHACRTDREVDNWIELACRERPV